MDTSYFEQSKGEIYRTLISRVDLEKLARISGEKARQAVAVMIQDIIAGGTESSATLVEWALAELLKKPETFEKATEELDRVVGRERWVEEKDIPDSITLGQLRPRR